MSRERKSRPSPCREDLKLNSTLEQNGECEEYDCKIEANGYASRDTATEDTTAKCVKGQVRSDQEWSGVRCRVVAQEHGYGERVDELFAGTLSGNTPR